MSRREVDKLKFQGEGKHWETSAEKRVRTPGEGEATVERNTRSKTGAAGSGIEHIDDIS
jgi:hypothetical protein